MLLPALHRATHPAETPGLTQGGYSWCWLSQRTPSQCRRLRRNESHSSLIFSVLHRFAMIDFGYIYHSTPPVLHQLSAPRLVLHCHSVCLPISALPFFSRRLPFVVLILYCAKCGPSSVTKVQQVCNDLSCACFCETFFVENIYPVSNPDDKFDQCAQLYHHNVLRGLKVEGGGQMWKTKQETSSLIKTTVDEQHLNMVRYWTES